MKSISTQLLSIKELMKSAFFANVIICGTVLFSSVGSSVAQSQRNIDFSKGLEGWRLYYGAVLFYNQTSLANNCSRLDDPKWGAKFDYYWDYDALIEGYKLRYNVDDCPFKDWTNAKQEPLKSYFSSIEESGAGYATTSNSFYEISGESAVKAAFFEKGCPYGELNDQYRFNVIEKKDESEGRGIYSDFNVNRYGHSMIGKVHDEDIDLPRVFPGAEHSCRIGASGAVTDGFAIDETPEYSPYSSEFAKPSWNVNMSHVAAAERMLYEFQKEDDDDVLMIHFLAVSEGPEVNHYGTGACDFSIDVFHAGENDNVDLGLVGDASSTWEKMLCGELTMNSLDMTCSQGHNYQCKHGEGTGACTDKNATKDNRLWFSTGSAPAIRNSASKGWRTLFFPIDKLKKGERIGLQFITRDCNFHKFEPGGHSCYMYFTCEVKKKEVKVALCDSVAGPLTAVATPGYGAYVFGIKTDDGFRRLHDDVLTTNEFQIDSDVATYWDLIKDSKFDGTFVCYMAPSTSKLDVPDSELENIDCVVKAESYFGATDMKAELLAPKGCPAGADNADGLNVSGLNAVYFHNYFESDSLKTINFYVKKGDADYPSVPDWTVDVDTCTVVVDGRNVSVPFSHQFVAASDYTEPYTIKVEMITAAECVRTDEQNFIPSSSLKPTFKIVGTCQNQEIKIVNESHNDIGDVKFSATYYLNGNAVEGKTGLQSLLTDDDVLVVAAPNGGTNSAYVVVTDENGCQYTSAETKVDVKTVVDKPITDDTEFIYDGNEQTYGIPENPLYKLSGNVQKTVGKYTVTVSLADADKYAWNDCSVAPVEFAFKIGKAKVEIPAELDSVFVYNGKEQTYELPENPLYAVTGNVQTKVGKYTVSISLTDTDNYEWSNGTVTPVEYAFEIGKAKVEIPAELDSVFVYNGKEQTYELPENPLYAVTGNVQTKAGKYTVSISLTDTDNYEWSNGSVTPVEYVFEIGKAKVEMPAELDSIFVYNGKEQTYELAENPLYAVAGNVQTKVGKYTVSISLTDTDNYEWSNGTVAPVEYAFEIDKAKVEIPAELDSVFVYNGKEQTYELQENPLYAVAGNVQTEVGKFTVSVSLTDTDNYEWSNGTVTPVEYSFEIGKAKVEIPTELDSIFVYNGKEQTYELLENPLYAVTGNVQTKVGKYTVSVSLTDTDNYEWSNGTITPVEYAFEIGKAKIEIPAKLDSVFVYNGKEQTYELAENPLYIVAGNVETKVGKYAVSISLTDTDNYEWSNGSVTPVEYVFEIGKAKVEIPAELDSVFVYNGKEQTYELAENPLYTVAGNVQTKVGKYTVSISLTDTDNYEWSNGTVAPIEYAFEIGKAKVEIPAKLDSVFVYNGKEQTYELAENPLYVVTGNVQTKVGKYTVSISLTDANNYEWSNGSVAPVEYSFEIGKAKVEIPAELDSIFVYNGKEQTYELAENPLYAVAGNAETKVGKYTVSVSLTDTDNYEWSNGTVTPIEYAFEIGKAKVEMPAELDSVFVYNGKEQTYELPENPLYAVAGNVQTKVGKYTVSISLTDTDNYEWSNGTVTPIEYAFEIGKAKVEMPAKLDSVFVYNGKEQTYELAENPLYAVTGNVQTKAGKYTVSISLTDTDNYEWSNGSVAPVEYSFEIGKAKVEMPAELDSVFVYNGKEQTYELPENPLYAVTGNVQTKVGKYTVSISLTDTDNYEWINGTVTPVEFAFEIVKAKVEIPAKLDSVFVYNGKEQTYELPENPLYAVAGNVQTKVGKYTVSVSLTDTDNYEWSNGTVAPVEFAFEIGKAKVEMPAELDSIFVYNGKEQTYELAENPLYTVAGNVQTKVGKYTVSVSLVDSDNYEWSNGSVAPVEYSFEIGKAKVEIPAELDSVFVYNGKEQTYELPENPLYTVAGNVQTKVGKYTVSISLVDSDNYEWSNGTVTPIEYAFEIGKAKVEMPAELDSVFVYNGKEQTYELPENSLYIVAGNAETKVGKYTVSVSLTDTDNYEWSNGTVAPVEYSFEIGKAKVEMPAELDSVFVYNGKEQTYELAENPLYTVAGNVQTKVGKYTVSVSLVDSDNYEWSNGTVTPIEYAFEIDKAKVEIPAKLDSVFVYNGKEQTYELPENPLYAVAGNAETKVGKYTVSISLTDANNYEWSNGSVAPVEYSFEIGKAKVEIPVELDSVFVYSGKEQTYELAENPLYTVAGNVQTEVGKYTVSVSLLNTDNYEWSNGTVAPVEFAFEIGKAKVEIPARLDSVFVYNGKEQTYELAENPLYTIVGNVQTEVGKYTVSVSLTDTDNYEWSNGTVAPVEYSFEIGKAKVEKPAELDSVFVYNGKEQTYELPENPLYAVTGNVQTKVGKYTVSVSLTDTDNYEWSNGTVTPVEYSFEIGKAKVEIPAELDSVFVYNGKEQTYELPENPLYAVAGNVQTEIGVYSVWVSLVDKVNYVWSDSSDADLSYEFVINNPAKDTMIIVIPDVVPEFKDTIASKDSVILYDKGGIYVYDIKFDSLAHEAGFVDLEQIPGNKGIRFSIPKDATPGTYSATLIITYSDGSVEERPFTFTVPKPKEKDVHSPLEVVLSVNPVRQNEQFKVLITGDTSEVDMTSSTLAVYNMIGQILYYKKGVDRNNVLTLDYNGVCIVVVDFGDWYESKRLMVK